MKTLILAVTFIPKIGLGHENIDSACDIQLKVGLGNENTDFSYDIHQQVRF